MIIHRPKREKKKPQVNYLQNVVEQFFFLFQEVGETRQSCVAAVKDVCSETSG